MKKYRWVVLALVPALLTLLAALWAGLLRMGWRWPVVQRGWVAEHGVLMIPVFFGGLISLERAVALRRRWAWLAPLLHGAAGLVLVLGGRALWAIPLLLGGAMIFVAMFVVIVRQHWAAYTVLMALAVSFLAIGDGLWGLLGWPVYRVVFWWVAFLVLTIAAERLELGRLQRLSRGAQAAFWGATALVVVGLAAPAAGVRLIGAGFVALALWLLRYDVSRKTVRLKGLPRFAALCLLSGYIWLAVGGLWMLAQGAQAAGLAYDGMLHAVLVGFVFSMIFGHAPIIFPSMLGRLAVFHRRLYVPLWGLHASLALRLLGDAFRLPALRRWGGLLGALFIVLFLVLMAVTFREGISWGET